MNVTQMDFGDSPELSDVEEWVELLEISGATQAQHRYDQKDATFQFSKRDPWSEKQDVLEFSIPYSKMYSMVVNDSLEHGYDDGQCYVHYTNTNSSAAERSRFVKRHFDEDDLSFSHVQIEKWKFSKKNVTPLKAMDFHEQVRFIKTYALVYIATKGGSVNDEWVADFHINTDGLPERIYSRVKNGKREVYSGTKVMDLDEPKPKKDKKTKKKEGKKMAGIMTAAEKAQEVTKQAIQINKDAAILAAKLEVGNVAVQQIKSKINFGWFADKKVKKHPLFDIALANVVGVALREVAGDNDKAVMLSEAMVQSAAVNMAQSFNINDMVDDLLKNVDLAKLIPSTK